MPIINIAARVSAPLPKPHSRFLSGTAFADVPPVVFTVSVVVAFPPAAIVTVAGFRSHVGGLCAFAGELLSLQLRFMVPE